MKKRCVFIFTIAALSACGDASSPTPVADTVAAQDSLPAGGAFVGRVWVSTKPGRPLGSMVVFLPNRSLIMDSCFETYRISEWGVAGDNIRWREDSIPIEASIELPSPDELSLHIVGQEESQTYIAASVPYVCPDMPK
jgi:hypothetical protein